MRGGGLIEALKLKDRLEGEIVEYAISSFFSDVMLNVLEEVCSLKDAWQVFGINYPLNSKDDVCNVDKFIEESLKCEGNLYYYPKPNYFLEIDDFALFSLKRNLTIDNYKIEKLYRNNLLDRKLRNRLHKMLRINEKVPQNILEKKFFLESRKLFNLSFSWSLYSVHQRMLFDDLLKKTTLFYNAPNQLAIELTNQCNLSCVMCIFHSKALQKPSFFLERVTLENDYVYQCIDYAVKYQCELDFTSPGEVLLDNRIYDFIKYAKEKGVKRVGLTSNATLLDKKATKKLLEAGLTYIRFSVDGASEETYRKIRGADINKVRNNIIYFMEQVRDLKKDVEINLNCVLVGKAKEEVGAYKEFWNPYLDVINYISFSHEISYYDNGYSKSPMPEGRYPCHWPWFNMLAVRPDGKVVACCSMSATIGRENVCVGDVRKNTLEEIWKGEAMQVLREENLTFDFKTFAICKTCTEWSNNRVLEGNVRTNGVVWESRDMPEERK
ncbi:radical SAM protein [Helicobacter sp.]|uniref:radical SAM/SPASM domain-containing protein n=1 Tax=Helicobacter sp. TaxID=218 RepID=UPI002A765113|nr:radical SAM protein [Helicobacter sp.]MDY2584358.1 radical SAM protein [Helicobacter sp.]